MSNSLKFSVVLTPEGEDWFSVTVPALPDVITKGYGREQALKRVKEAIELAIEQCVADGEEIPRAGFTTTRVKDSHHILKKPDDPARAVTIAVHGNEDLKPGPLRKILQQAGMTTNDLDDLL